jgi:Undecaprenyl-phosphate galactose phosphotransferase WbaP
MSLHPIKRLIDLLAASAALVIGLPLFILIYVGIELTEPGPALFVQPRLGWRGKTFKLLKFRTMYCNSEQVLRDYLQLHPEEKTKWDKYQKLTNDPRVTPFGKWLRRTSLDELPQLFNVLKGEMSLVGPRPVLESELEMYRPVYHYYIQVLPGLTGLWQVSGRSATPYRYRRLLDRWYVENWSLCLDIMIMLRTIPTVLTMRGAS